MKVHMRRLFILIFFQRWVGLQPLKRMAGVVTMVDNGKGEVGDIAIIIGSILSSLVSATTIIIFIISGGDPLCGQPVVRGRPKEVGFHGGFSQR